MARPKIKIDWEYSSLPLKEAQKLRGCFIYCIYNNEGELKYIGQTVNPMYRFYCYTNTEYCHNSSLAAILNSEKTTISLFSAKKEDLDRLESSLIKSHKESLVNILMSSKVNWTENKKKPWTATNGILCPSSYVLRDQGKSLGRNNKEYIKYKNGVIEDRNQMTTVERCKYEVAVAMSASKYSRYKNAIKKWLSYGCEPMIRIIKAECNG